MSVQGPKVTYMLLCSECREEVRTCARCGGCLYVEDALRCDPDEGRPRHMHDGECPHAHAEQKPAQ